MDKPKVLFLCMGNSARSQMAEAFLRHYGGDRFEAYSAGLEPKEIHPMTRQVMAEVGLDLTGQFSKSLDVYKDRVTFDYLITLCTEAEEACPDFPGAGERLHWHFDDPAASGGSEAEKLEKGRLVRDQIEIAVQDWLAGTKTG